LTVGKPLPRKDARIKVRGEAKYIYDLSFGDEHYLYVIRSPHARAKIKNIIIDQEEIQKLKATVATFKDIPGKNVVHVILDDWPLLAEKIVNHVGQPVAIVVGSSPKVAKIAASHVKVEYEVLEPVFDPDKAKNHPSIHIFGKNNICSYWQQKNGDVEKAFEESDVIIEEEYRTPAQEHAYIEVQGAIAVPIGNDEITVYGTMQCPFYVQRCVAETLGLDWSKVRIVQTVTGGAFGGKEDQPNQIASLAALGAWLTRKPVKYILTREEDVENTSKRHPAIIRMKTGATKDGVLKAVQAEILLNTGAYATLAPAVLYRSCLHSVGPYRCENVDIQAYAITTNLVPFGAFRGFGAPQVLFACEENMDRIAEKLGMDPTVFREKNLLKAGDKASFGQLLDHSVGSHETLRKAKEKSGWDKKWRPNPDIEQVVKDAEEGKYLKRGIGVSTIFYGVGLGSAGKMLSRTASYVQLEPDGSVRFAVGTTEMGQGMITVLSQIVAEELGIDYDRVKMVPTDTSRVPDSGPTVASRSTTFSGRALQDACRQIRELMYDIVGKKLEVKPEKLTISEGKVLVKDQPNKSMSVTEAIQLMYQERGCVAASGWDVAPNTDYDNEKGQGKAYVTYAWCTNVVEVEVDVLTGTTEVLNIWAAHDVGKAINPQTLEGQIEGGSLQGMGYGRYEQIVWTPEGRILSNNLGTYLIPTTKDTPKIHPIIVEDPWKEGPYGAKGIGEQPLMGIAPAVTNAIANAIGVRINEIPATAERVWKAIQEKLEVSK